MWNSIRHTNILQESQREKRENMKEGHFEEIIYKNFSDLVKDIQLHIQKV